MPYTHLTRAQFRADIASLLGDTGYVYWSADEINRSINESLLLWGLLTAHWKERGTFPTVAGTAFYDMPDELPTLITRTYTLGDLTKEIQYHLLEPSTGVVGAGMTGQFNVANLTSSINRRRNQLLLDAETDVHSATWAVAPPPSGRTQLDQSIALVQRACWHGVNGVNTVLRREDAWSAGSQNYLWNLTPGTPWGYSLAETRPIEIQFIPPPLAGGVLHLMYSDTVVMAVADGTLLSMHDEFAHIAKWGTLHDLLSTSSEAFDPIRAKYCLERYTQGVEAAKLSKVVIRLQLNDQNLPIDALINLDLSRPNWESVTGRPNACGLLAHLVGLSKVPDAVYGMSVDIVRSAPLPAGDASFIQIGREELDYLIGYVRHILSFKLGGEEFLSTLPLYDSFLKGAAQRNKILGIRAKYLTPLFTQDRKQSEIEAAA